MDRIFWELLHRRRQAEIADRAARAWYLAAPRRTRTRRPLPRRESD
jgi:hypothetical protein